MALCGIFNPGYQSWIWPCSQSCDVELFPILVTVDMAFPILDMALLPILREYGIVSNPGYGLVSNPVMWNCFQSWLPWVWHCFQSCDVVVADTVMWPCFQLQSWMWDCFQSWLPWRWYHFYIVYSIYGSSFHLISAPPLCNFSVDVLCGGVWYGVKQ